MTQHKDKQISNALRPAAQHLAEAKVDKLLTKGFVPYSEREKLIKKETLLQLESLEETLKVSSGKMGKGLMLLKEIAKDISDLQKQREAEEELEKILIHLRNLSKDILKQLEVGEPLDEEWLNKKLGDGFPLSQEVFLSLYEKTSLLYQEGIFEKSFLALSALCFIKPYSPNLWIARGMAAFKSELYEEAIASYYAVKQMFPDDPRPYPYLIDVYLVQKENDKAKIEFHHFLDLIHKKKEEEKWRPTVENIQKAINQM